MRCPSALLLWLTAATWGQPCAPYWIDGGHTTIGSRLYEQVGNDLYCTTSAPPRVWRRVSGGGWEPLDMGPIPLKVITMRPIALDDGVGPALYVRIRENDGTSNGRYRAFRRITAGWLEMPVGFYSHEWNAVGSADLGAGSIIYGVRGYEFGGVQTQFGRWNSQQWEVIANTVNTNNVEGILVIDGYLHVFGLAEVEGVAFPSAVARWLGGNSWTEPWPTMAYWSWGSVRLHYAWTDFGFGPELYMIRLNPQREDYRPALTRYRNGQWTAIAYASTGPLIGPIYAVAAQTDARGPGVYVSSGDPIGGLPGGLHRWNGATLEPVAPPGPKALFGVQDLRGPSLLVASGSGGYSVNGGAYLSSVLYVGCPSCYPNCDASTAAPTLNVGDFTCFLQRFAASDPYANCDNSTAAPAINVADFTCFLSRFAAGCP
jgi:hypothetical protein